MIVGTDGEIEREMTPITLKIICMREGERGRQRQHSEREISGEKEYFLLHTLLI